VGQAVGEDDDQGHAFELLAGRARLRLAVGCEGSANSLGIPTQSQVPYPSGGALRSGRLIDYKFSDPGAGRTRVGAEVAFLGRTSAARFPCRRGFARGTASTYQELGSVRAQPEAMVNRALTDSVNRNASK